jgi:hypothetical protein
MKNRFLTIILSVTIFGAVYATEYPAPERHEITVQELQMNRVDYVGKVVEIEANGFSDLGQAATDEYTVSCEFYDNNSWSLLASITVSFSGEKGKKYFEKLVKTSTTGSAWGEMSEKFYVYVDGKNKFVALGSRYSKSKKEYSW